MRRVTSICMISIFTAGCGMLYARAISKPLAVFESTKIPRRTLAEGPSIFNTLPFVNESNLSKEDKKKYQKMLKEKKKKDIENAKYWSQPNMKLLNSANLPKREDGKRLLPNLFK